MQMWRHTFIGLWIIPVLLLATSCDWESRDFRQTPPRGEQFAAVQESELQPGMPLPEVAVSNPYANNSEAIAEGRRLYNWYNCVGCHAGGGGGMGPPLMDEEWIYGSNPANIFETIVKGRPNGMPAYGGKIPSDHVWKLVAFVQTLGGTEQSNEGKQLLESESWRPPEQK